MLSLNWGAYGGGMSVGSYIMILATSHVWGYEYGQAFPECPDFQHEYGHYIQSQITGPFYMILASLSGVEAIKYNFSHYSAESHSHFWVEQTANILGREFFGRDVWINSKYGNPIYNIEKWTWDVWDFTYFY